MNNNNLCISRFIRLDNYLYIIKKLNFTAIKILKSTFHYKTSKELIILYRMNYIFDCYVISTFVRF